LVSEALAEIFDDEILTSHDERAVLGSVPEFRVLLLQVKSQLAPTVIRQVMNPLVAQPEVAAVTAKANSEFIPRSIEETGLINVLLNQYRFLSGVVCNK